MGLLDSKGPCHHRARRTTKRGGKTRRNRAVGCRKSSTVFGSRTEIVWIGQGLGRVKLVC